MRSISPDFGQSESFTGQQYMQTGSFYGKLSVVVD